MVYLNGNGRTLKWLAVGVIAVLEVSAVVYLREFPVTGASQNPFLIPTSTSTTSSTSQVITTSTHTTTQVVDHLDLKSPIIENGSLMFSVLNEGPAETTRLAVTSVCTPGFIYCVGYKRLAGGSYLETFDLPPGDTFDASLPGVCVMAISGCTHYLPIANNTYYLQLSFTWANGYTLTVPVAAEANDTWAPHPTAVQGIAPPQVVIVPKNLTGYFDANITVYSSLSNATFKSVLYTSNNPKAGWNTPILSNETGCGTFNKSNFTYVVTSSCTPTVVITGFSTVTTGIAPGALYALVVHDLTKDKGKGMPDASVYSIAYAAWVEAEAVPTSTSSSSS